MAEPVLIAITVQGGVMQGVLTAGVPVRFVLVDYDADGANVPQADGSTAPAFVAMGDADQDGPRVLELASLAERLD